MARTTIAVDSATRDALTAVAKRPGGNASLDDALRSLLWEHECRESLARLDADPQLREDYRRESQEWAELDVAVTE
jgi:hypothetical protein